MTHLQRVKFLRTKQDQNLSIEVDDVAEKDSEDRRADDGLGT